MTPEQRREQGKYLISNIDWNTYDYTVAEGADMTFPDFPEGETVNTRPVWLSKHYNNTSNMATCHVTDLNDIPGGFARRLMAQYGVPVEWTGGEESEYLARIEKLDQAKAAGAELFAQWLSYYGIVNEEHLEWMRERVTGEVGSVTRAAAQSMLDNKMEEQKQMQAARADGMRETGELAPFMGVALEDWARCQAGLASGATLEQILPSLGVDEATWQAVSAEWNARMARDTTVTIATVYGQAFTGAGAGQFGASGQAAAGAMNPGGSVAGSEAPVPFERWIEITVAQGAGADQGKDPTAVLAAFGISPAEWGTIGAWWGQKFNANAMEMMEEYNKWTAHYEAQYGVGHADGLTSDEREEQVIAHILEMARTGQAAQIVAFLKEKFPDDADDMDALDWWVDKACDLCGEQGDRSTAAQLLPVRYGLQEDEEDPMHEWVESEMESLF